MTFAGIQQWVVERLQSDTNLDGVPVLAEDGSYPRTPRREAALAAEGLCLIVWQNESEGVESLGDDGTTIHTVGVHISIEENQVVCRSDSGVGITAEEAVDFVMRRMAGATDDTSAITRTPFFLMDPPFKGFGKENGVNRWVVSTARLMVVSPGS